MRGSPSHDARPLTRRSAPPSPRERGEGQCDTGPNYESGAPLLPSPHITLQLAAGDRLAQYEILGPLGAGGMGEVYRARDAKLERDVALKILPAELSASPEALRRFEQEARAASALNHPNIVIIYEIGRTDDMAWIAMELVDGIDLRTMLAREPLTLKTALRMAVKIADGLAAAHEKGIVHRDLKPDNVMVTPDGFVKVLDFGLAKQVRAITADDTTIPHTSPGAVFGTVGYMSPEQTVGKEMDYRSDQFSFGVMLFEMLTRIRPFDMETKPETMAAIIRAEIEPPSAHNEAVPYDLDRIVARCLAKNPRDRYAATRDLARDLREIRDGMTHSSARVRSSPATRGGTTSRRRIRFSHVAYALLTILLLTGGAFMWTRRDLAEAGQRVTSLAVLPFRDLTVTSEGRILADGISELIAVRLGEVRELRVSSPSEGPPLKDNDDIVSIALRRGMHAVVRGTVQRSGDDVRVTYALVEAKSGRTLASSTVTRPHTDLFALEDAIADELVDALGRKVAPRTQHATAVLGPHDQRRFTEAVGLLQRVKDEKSVDQAIASLESILRNARESGAVNALLARALLYKASLARRPALIEQATVYATRGVALSGDDPESHNTLGRLLNASGRYDDAVTAFNRALALRPNDASATLGLAEAYDRQGRGQDAEKMYRTAITLRPDSFGVYMSFGAFCYSRGRYEEAVLQFRKAAALVPDSARSHANLGGALQALNRHDQALEAYQRSLAIEPTANGWSNLGSLQFFLGRYKEARDAYQRATELSPSDYLMWANLGDACRALGDRACTSEAWPHAISAARAALAVNAKDAFTRAVLASSLAKHGNLDEAQGEIRRALEIDPTNAQVLYQAAVVGAIRGAPDSALSWLERAIAAGYPAADAERDPVLEPLRKMPSFRSAVESRS
jgi:serine/threonine protein kinase/Flp pilus assembly protein TadD/TolB-like protein